MDSPDQQLNYQQSLIQAGLNADQAIVYEFLIKNGPVPAGKISLRTPLKRGLVYKVLEQLEESGLVIKTDTPGKVAIFEPAHPLKLKELAEKKEEQAKTAQQALAGVMDKLSLDFNLISGKPGVKFYEGKEGLINIYEELLHQRKNIDSFEDKGDMTALIPEYANNYPHRRVRRNIFNRVIAPSDNPINTTDPEKMRESRFIPTDNFPFRMDIKIAGRLVSIITFQKEHPVGVLIDNEEIAENFQMLFEFVWKSLEPKLASTATPTTQPV